MTKTSNPKVCVATLTCDRKGWPEFSPAIPHKLTYENMVYYVNVETQKLDACEWSPPMLRKINHIYPQTQHEADFWSCVSTWKQPPQSDQDQARLRNIIIARNMARDFAQDCHAEWLLFLDADVVVPEDSIQKLLEVSEGATILGGIVPGRENNYDIFYLFHPLTPEGNAAAHITPYEVNGIRCANYVHGTCGFMMIHRSVFSCLPFTYILDEALSEDPAYAHSAIKWSLAPQGWRIRLDLIAEHPLPLHSWKPSANAQ